MHGAMKMHASWPQAALLAPLLLCNAFDDVQTDGPSSESEVCQCPKGEVRGEYKWLFFACLPFILFLELVIALLLIRDNKRKETLAKAQLVAVSHTPSTCEGDLDSTLTKTIRFMEKVSGTRSLDNSRSRWQEWTLEASQLRTALLSNQDLHKPINFREELMKKYNSATSKEEGVERRHTSEIVRFLIGSNTSELVTLPMDRSCNHPGVSPNSLLSMSASVNALEHEADANVRIARVLKTLNKQHNIPWDKVCRSFFVDFTVGADAPQGVLVAATMVVLYRFNLFELLEMDDTQVGQFLSKVEQGYPNNPYHNAGHAADVTARLGTILHTSGIALRLLSTGEMGAVKLLAVILAAAMHDYEHPGHTNQYAVVMGLKQAKIYNDKTVYENWSLYCALAFMDMPCFPFHGFPFRQELRTSIINFVLATDMSSHFDLVGNAKNTLVGLIKPDKGIDFFELEPKQQDSILKLALKVADIGHCATPLPQHIRWVERLQKEFFAQGDMERMNAITISPLMDRTKSGPCKGRNQVGFFEVIVIPLYKLWVLMFPTCKPLLHQVSKNLEFWQQHPGDPPALMEQLLSESRAKGLAQATETLIATFRTATQQVLQGRTGSNKIEQDQGISEQSFEQSFETYHSYSRAARHVNAAPAPAVPYQRHLIEQLPKGADTVIDINANLLSKSRDILSKPRESCPEPVRKMSSMIDGHHLSSLIEATTSSVTLLDSAESDP